MSIYRGKTTKDIYLANSLYDAIDDEDISSIDIFLTKGADCNLVLPKKGIAPFHLVIGKEPEDFATYYTIKLLQNKADPNVRSDDGLTPMHIAAAYGRNDILYTLLCCGGNPDLRDSNYKRPIDYAQEFGNKKCFELLLSFMEKPNIFFRKDLNPAFNITLEKIVVENSGHTGEYEVIQEYKTEPLTEKNLESLRDLPETDATEYVINWCQNQLQNASTPLDNTEEISQPKSEILDSSCDESDGGKSVEYRIKSDNIVFRKRYRHKVRRSKSHDNVARDTTGNLTPSTKRYNISDNDVNYSSISKPENSKEMFTLPREFSKESGIVTLSNSNVNFLDVSPKQLTDRLQCVIETSNSSSDYRTCSQITPDISANVLNKSIVDLTNDVSRLTVCEAAKSRRSSTKSEGVFSTDVSFVSVSEVYKYVDEEEGIVLYEKRFLKTGTSDCAGSVRSSLSSKLSSVTASVDYDTDTLRKELTIHGYNPGPITLTTKRVYLRKLKQIRKQPISQTSTESNKKIYSVELEKAMRDQNWLKDPTYKSLEEILAREFVNPNPSRKWREGVNKTSFTYLLLDPRKTNNLPFRADNMDPRELWEIFLSSIFYVGKGKRSRPYSHLYEAVKLWKDGKRSSDNRKLNEILSIWNDNGGVICLHIFQNVIPVEAFTREAAIISALKLENLKNLKAGEFYGIVSTWAQKQKKMLGVYLLYKAMMIFLNEGERQLCPNDIE